MPLRKFGIPPHGGIPFFAGESPRVLKTAQEKRSWSGWLWGLALDLRNVRGFGWRRMRVYRICRELELNLRIKLKERLVRERSEPLAVPEAIHQVWSMDFNTRPAQ